MPQGFGFEQRATDGDARHGRLTTPHGQVATPAFMPVATYGAVRGVAPEDLGPLGAEIVLANTFHLHERPGEAVVEQLGGLAGFTGWRGPWLTDSGGFQVTSLGDRMKLDEHGVTFHSPVDGRARELTPERAIAIQEALGADVAMALDECRPLDAARDPATARAAMERTLRWGERCQSARTRPEQAVFGIVQGGVDASLRRESARATVAIGFDGFAHGGLGLGEEPVLRESLVAEANAHLPVGAPRYLMGLGRPADLVAGIAVGVDLFDCVLPTRHARHGVLFTSQGTLHLKNARHRDDERPPDPECDCPACRTHSRAYLRHLIHMNEMLGKRLATLHNLRFYLRLMQRARAAIEAGRFGALRREIDALETAAD